jgi:peptidoglycan/LPS O-acetylase OafA/YrhL
LATWTILEDDPTVTQWIQVLLIGLAGFLLFPVPIAIATFYVLPTGERRKWLAVAAWSVSAAAYTVSVVLFYWNGPPYSELLLNLRVGTFYLSILSFIWVVTELSGRFFRKLAIALCALVAIRAVLWFTTELIWIQGFTPTGEQISGPLEVWSRAGISLIVAAILVASVRQPWPSELARKASTWVVFPVAVVLSFIYEVQSPDFDALQALLAAVPLLVIEVAVLSDLARAARAASSSRRRVLLLEEMTTESLAPGHAVTAGLRCDRRGTEPGALRIPHDRRTRWC